MNEEEITRRLLKLEAQTHALMFLVRALLREHPELSEPWLRDLQGVGEVLQAFSLTDVQIEQALQALKAMTTPD